MTTTRREIARALALEDARLQADGAADPQRERCLELGLGLLRLLDAVDRNVPAWDQSPAWLCPSLEAMLARAWGVDPTDGRDPPSEPYRAA